MYVSEMYRVYIANKKTKKTHLYAYADEYDQVDQIKSEIKEKINNKKLRLPNGNKANVILVQSEHGRVETIEM